MPRPLPRTYADAAATAARGSGQQGKGRVFVAVVAGRAGGGRRGSPAVAEEVHGGGRAEESSRETGGAIGGD